MTALITFQCFQILKNIAEIMLSISRYGRGGSNPTSTYSRLIRSRKVFFVN